MEEKIKEKKEELRLWLLRQHNPAGLILFNTIEFMINKNGKTK